MTGRLSILKMKLNRTSRTGPIYGKNYSPISYWNIYN